MNPENWYPVQADPHANYLEILKWCREQFGWTPTVNLYIGQDWLYSPGSSHFEFKHERDAVFFALRWA